MSPPCNADLGYIPPDGGWGWAVVFGACISVGFAYSFPKAFTIYYKELQAVYNISYGQIAWVSSIMCATTYGGGVISVGGPVVEQEGETSARHGGENRYGCSQSSERDRGAIYGDEPFGKPTSPIE